MEINGIPTEVVPAYDLEAWDAVVMGDKFWIVTSVDNSTNGQRVCFHGISQARLIPSNRKLRIAKRP